MSDYSIEDLARLARLRLTADEISALDGDLGRILEFVAHLKDVDIEGIDPVASINGLETISRPDETAPCLARESVLGTSPSHNAGFVKVPKVLE